MTKQRLVGAVVIVSLLVIFLPMILTGGGDLTPELGAKSVPNDPEYQFTPLPVPQSVPSMPPPLAESADDDIDSEAIPPESASEEPVAVPEPSSKAPPSVTTAPPKAPAGWVIQLGSFGEEKNANGLRDQLRAKGYISFVEASTDKGKKTYRVRIGPELTRELAEGVQKKLVRDGQSAGIIVSYP
jgi:DedD protein